MLESVEKNARRRDRRGRVGGNVLEEHPPSCLCVTGSALRVARCEGTCNACRKSGRHSEQFNGNGDDANSVEAPRYGSLGIDE